MSRRRLGWLLCLGLLQPGCLLLDSTTSIANKPREDARLLPTKQSAQLCMTVAETLANQGHLQEAVEQLHKARMHDARADVSRPLARLYARLRRDQDALDEFAKAIKAHPTDAELFNDLGYFQYERGNWPDAERELRKAVGIAPNHPRAWMNLGLVLGQQNKYEESLAAFEKVGRPAEARCNLAFVFTTQGKRSEAKEAYLEALRIDPGQKLARQALQEMERPTSAKTPRSTAVKATPTPAQRIELLPPRGPIDRKVGG